jgi:ribosomal protein L11 methyltransferase
VQPFYRIFELKTDHQQKGQWLLVEFEIERSQEDLAGWLMMQLGANGCELRDEGDKLFLQATFPEGKIQGDDIAPINAALDEYGLSKCIASLKTRTLHEEDWLAKWKEGFEPFPIGKRLTICPPWRQDGLTAEHTKGRHVILIEPGLAFGTGFHTTTQFCLASVERLAPSSKRILDVGTGSGILAIASALLNCEADVVAVETDPLACRVAGENFELNNVAARIKLLEGSTEMLAGGEKFDLILSNLTFEDIAALLDDYVKLLANGGKMVFAGVLAEKLPRLKPLLEARKLKVETEEVGPMWAGLVAGRS